MLVVVPLSGFVRLVASINHSARPTGIEPATPTT
jgi:hypothetical protein